MGRYFTKQLYIFPELSFAYIGTVSDEFYGARKIDSGQLQVTRSNESTRGFCNYYSVDDRGNPAKLVEQRPDYHPADRPWFQRAVQARKASWSPVYIDFSGRGLAITAVRPFYRGNTLQGVFGSSFVLKDIDNFLGKLKISETGVAFIIERSGELVATSTGEPLVQGDPMDGNRLNFAQSRVSLIQRASEALLRDVPDLRDLDGKRKVMFSSDGERNFLYVSPYRDQYGLDWMTAVVIGGTARFLRQTTLSWTKQEHPVSLML